MRLVLAVVAAQEERLSAHLARGQGAMQIRGSKLVGQGLYDAILPTCFQDPCFPIVAEHGVGLEPLLRPELALKGRLVRLDERLRLLDPRAPPAGTPDAAAAAGAPAAAASRRKLKPRETPIIGGSPCVVRHQAATLRDHLRLPQRSSGRHPQGSGCEPQIA